jgi:hypothetical protein
VWLWHCYRSHLCTPHAAVNPCNCQQGQHHLNIIDAALSSRGCASPRPAHFRLLCFSSWNLFSDTSINEDAIAACHCNNQQPAAYCMRRFLHALPDTWLVSVPVCDGLKLEAAFLGNSRESAPSVLWGHLCPTSLHCNACDALLLCSCREACLHGHSFYHLNIWSNWTRNK